MIRALVFDFDGLILDTETPAMESWREIYADYGFDLPMDLWVTTLGRGPGQGFDPATYLLGDLGVQADINALWARRQARKHELTQQLGLLPGVAALLQAAAARDMPCAVASSSTKAWVVPLLMRHGIFEHFTCIRTADDVEHTKPAPDLFLSAAQCLGVLPVECLVFEDSPNGAVAARAAGMRCAAVPSALTAPLQFPPTDLRLQGLDQYPLDELLHKLDLLTP